MSEKKAGRKTGQKDKQPRKKRKPKHGKRITLRGVTVHPGTLEIIQRIQDNWKPKKISAGKVIDVFAVVWECSVKKEAERRGIDL